MIIVHDTFVCKPGNASKMAKMFKEVMAGNKVILRSGGPEMIVAETDGERALCQWMIGTTLQAELFLLTCLTCYGAR